MAKLVVFNKPMNVLSQFTDTQGRSTLKDYIQETNLYPAGRLDYDSEGLLILTDDGALQAKISHPRHKQPKTYWVQVEGKITQEALSRLEKGILLNDGPTKPANATVIDPPEIWERDPPVRQRRNIPTSWIALTILEGRNRQVRRMTAAVGFPTLRLIRYSIGPWSIDNLPPGEARLEKIHLPASPRRHSNPRTARDNRNVRKISDFRGKRKH
ncbi:pseudouridine synthase [Hahella sp. CCB-MM4]|uniref:pseudouridine synthase n=1 Tax=Hahella sp. (strain CCB-MM4) TaxID=1926491 RepID=UPI000B9C0342|nr:pseudouridine synthase [Hahella sp. CCB-MM4]OZG73700.1 pseudouridine synthase [Hahella sp. CCB-MM4]